MSLQVVRPGDYVAGYIITFADDGDDYERTLHVGSEEDCYGVAGMIDHVNYKGDREIENVRMIVAPAPTDWHWQTVEVDGPDLPNPNGQPAG